MTPTPNLQRTFQQDPKYFYYFAYGSNLLSERLHLMNPTAEFVAVGYVRGYTLGFYGTSKFWQGAAATIYPSIGDKVFGCIWRLSIEDSESLDYQERRYRRFDVMVEIPNAYGGAINCRTYEIIEFDPFIPGKDLPSPHYKHVIVSGAIEHGFPEEYVKYLKSLPDNGYIGSVQLKLNVLTHLNNEVAA